VEPSTGEPLRREAPFSAAAPLGHRRTEMEISLAPFKRMLMLLGRQFVNARPILPSAASAAAHSISLHNNKNGA
jgi:hypothetical protein